MHYLLFIGLLFALPAPAASLHEALESAWQRSPQARALQAGEEEIQARRATAESLTPAPAALSVSQRGDQFNADRGQREWELELGIPLWLPGERGARRHLAATATSENSAAQAALRLALAGELRSALWEWRLARAEAQLAGERLDSAVALERSVQRRVAAGDLARVDLNLARSETLVAQSALLEREARVAESLRNWQALAGDTPAPEEEEESPATAPLSEHPVLKAAQLATELAQARLGLARETPRDSPELALFSRSERGNVDAAYVNSLGIRLRLPLASEARNRPLLAAANRDLIRAESEATQIQRRLALDVERARRNLADALSLLDLAASQRELARENLAWLQKAFDLGETSLFNLLKTRATHLEAELALALRRIGVAQAKARLNQAQGVLP